MDISKEENCGVFRWNYWLEEDAGEIKFSPGRSWQTGLSSAGGGGGGALNLDLDNKGTMHSVSLLTIGRGGRAKSIEEDVNSNTPYVGEASPV